MKMSPKVFLFYYLYYHIFLPQILFAFFTYRKWHTAALPVALLQKAIIRLHDMKHQKKNQTLYFE